jgi:hypothetical protein
MNLSLVCWQVLSRLNRLLLPRMSKRTSLIGLKKWEQIVVGWRIYVTYRLLDAQNASTSQA